MCVCQRMRMHMRATAYTYTHTHTHAPYAHLLCTHKQGYAYAHAFAYARMHVCMNACKHNQTNTQPRATPHNPVQPRKYAPTDSRKRARRLLSPRADLRATTAAGIHASLS